MNYHKKIKLLIPTIEEPKASAVDSYCKLFRATGADDEFYEKLSCSIGYDKERAGFTRNVNQLISHEFDLYTTYAGFLLMNDDAEPLSVDTKGFMKFVEDHPNAGIIGFKVYSDKDKKHIYHAGGLQMYPSGIHKGGSTDIFKKPTRENWVNFSAVFIKSEMIRDIGLLDNNYKMFFSDSDYCLTARARGWDVWFYPDMLFYHEIGVSGKLEGEMYDQFILDRQYFEKKWFSMQAVNAANQIPTLVTHTTPSGLFYDLNAEIFEE